MLLSEIPNISNSNKEKYSKLNLAYNEYINSIPNLEYLLSELQDLYSINFILYMSKFIEDISKPDLTHQPVIQIIGKAASGKTTLGQILTKYYPHIRFYSIKGNSFKDNGRELSGCIQITRLDWRK